MILLSPSGSFILLGTVAFYHPQSWASTAILVNPRWWRPHDAMPENLQIDCIREKEARWRNNQPAAPQSLKVRDRGRPPAPNSTALHSPSCTGPRHARWGARALPCPAVPYLAHPPPVHHPLRRPDPSRPASGRRPSQRRPAPLGAALASAVRGRTCLPTPTLLCLLSSTAQHTTSAWHQDPRHPDPGLMRTRPLPPPG